MEKFNTITKKLFIVMIFVSAAFLVKAETADVFNIAFDIPSPAALSLNKKVNITFDYSTDVPDGIHVFFATYSEGEYSEGISNSGSTTYTGNGSGAFWFKQYQAVTGHIDEIRVRITNADQSEVYKVFFIPVSYYYGDYGLTNFQFDKPDNSSLLLGENLNITFDYEMADGVSAQVFLRPFTDGSLTQGYGASGGPELSGSGSHTAFFTINNGVNVKVDEIRVQVKNDDGLLVEFFIPVNYYFSAVKLATISFNRSDGAFLYFDDAFIATMEYETTASDGIKIFVRPMTRGDLTDGYAAGGSSLYPVGTGSATNQFTFHEAAGNTYVDQVRIRVYNSDQSVLLLEQFIDMKLFYGFSWISSIVSCPSMSSRMTTGQFVNILYNYYNDEDENVRVFVRPFTEGALSPGYAAAGAEILEAGTGVGSTYFTINSGDVVVDELRFQIKSEDQSTIFLEFFVPVDYHFEDATVDVKNLVDPKISFSTPSPNPVVDKSYFSVSLEEASNVNIDILDVTGAEMKNLFTGKMQANQERDFVFSADELGSGIYFIRISGDNFVETKKVVVMK